VPVGTAILGTILAVAALCGTAIFSTSLTTLTTTPHLYGDDYQAIVYAQSAGRPDQDPIIARLEHSPLVAALTVGTGASFNASGVRFTVFATQAVRGSTLLSAVTGRLPAGPGEIALGVTTLRAIGARVGSDIRVTGQGSGSGPPVATRFRVVGTVALPTGVAQDQAGMGTGGAMTLAGFFAAQCPNGPAQRTCVKAAHQNVQGAAFVRAVPGPRGAAAIAHLVAANPQSTATPVPPTGLVNLGEAVNFPLIFGLLLALFGVATLGHLLVVSVSRRRHEMGLLKALGFFNWQVAAAVYWQATTVAIIGLLIGVPLGVALGRSVWRAFAINIGVVPLPVIDVAMVVAIAIGVLVVGALLALASAVVAGRSKPGLLLRTE
jgi:ABC-type lipoprotein release transport system permease subunit